MNTLNTTSYIQVLFRFSCGTVENGNTKSDRINNKRTKNRIGAMAIA